ncbi:MAG: hypothetical protein LBS21_14215 [Clostridiales bacterium]|jgi:Fic family protein|nr:hypothetical protein [Clostridiales bacterium]
MQLQAMLKKIDETKELINVKRPLAPEEIKQLDAYFRIGTTYSSNALEGNSLTLSETKVISYKPRLSGYNNTSCITAGLH